MLLVRRRALRDVPFDGAARSDDEPGGPVLDREQRLRRPTGGHPTQDLVSREEAGPGVGHPTAVPAGPATPISEAAIFL